jgi:hypothetical protein
MGLIKPGYMSIPETRHPFVVSLEHGMHPSEERAHGSSLPVAKREVSFWWTTRKRSSLKVPLYETSHGVKSTPPRDGWYASWNGGGIGTPLPRLSMTQIFVSNG